VCRIVFLVSQAGPFSLVLAATHDMATTQVRLCRHRFSPTG
jgi:hypothetical protein